MKKKYHIVFCAEGSAEGTVELTDEEYALVKACLNGSNWTNVHEDPWSPHCWIEPEIEPEDE